MQDEKDGWKGLTGATSKESRQQRLKLALRENLKRRKVQIRGRSGPAPSSSEPDDGGGDEPGR